MAEINFFRPAKGSHEWAWAVDGIRHGHYLGRMPDPRCSFELYVVHLRVPVGVLIVGRPEATRCSAWYGSVDDVRAGRCEVTRWQVLNLARVWIDPDFQAGGPYCRPGHVPGFYDRHGEWRSTLASTAVKAALGWIGHDYLLHRPPCYLEEPYAIRWLLSYCDPARHRGTLYRMAGFELFRTNARGLQTWRIALPALTVAQDLQVRTVAATHPRSVAYRAKRSQLALPEVNA